MSKNRDFSDPGRLASSFTDFLRTERPELLPQPMTGTLETIDATTIVALRFREGVVMAGDRRATEGFSIAHRAMEKVFAADTYSAIGIAGAAGPAMEMVRLFQTELEYYEKVEGEALSLAGKANHLGRLIRGNLAAAMQGFVVLPLFGGYDQRKGEGRIYRYDVTGGLSEETDYHAVGSGGRDAKNSLKKLYARAAEVDEQRAIEIAVEALTDAAEEDAGTAGPDPVHGIYPTVWVRPSR
jgi:proteasome beta subunit